jgi:hypothetical protein
MHAWFKRAGPPNLGELLLGCQGSAGIGGGLNFSFALMSVVMGSSGVVAKVGGFVRRWRGGEMTRW